MVNIAINGFGRIGRLFFRRAFEDPALTVVAINDLGDAENLAYLLSHDTVYGRWHSSDVRVDNGDLVIGDRRVKFLAERDPHKLPWKELNIDVALESTGAFESFDAAKVHIEAGAKRVVITAPAKDADGEIGKTVLIGINEGDAVGVAVTSNGSCTTNAASPVVQALDRALGIEKALLSTVHAYTATQSIVDGPTKGKDYRRGRAAAQNISPSTTGAAIAVTRVIPSLADKFDGIALRVPVPAGSIADITFISKRPTTVDEVNGILKQAAASPEWKGILAVSEEQLVSSDIVGEPFGAIVDLGFTKVVGGNLVKVLSWYDNEAGYVSTLVRHVHSVAGRL
jgi:glyceraldehyde 3-phosphate dehydrogenase